MPYTIVMYLWRKPSLSPSAFKSYYETTHVPLIHSLGGPLYPESHTRHYIDRSSSSSASKSGSDEEARNHPATVLVGEQSDFTYDAYSELVFSDEGAYLAFFAAVSKPEKWKVIARDEEMFLDRPKTKIVVLEGVSTTVRGDA